LHEAHKEILEFLGRPSARGNLSKNGSDECNRETPILGE